MKAGEIPKNLKSNAGPDFAENAMVLCRELIKWGKVHNLTGHRDIDSAWEDLILDGLALASMVRPSKMLDIGSGAGFPGIPLALARDELQVTLLEPRAKRISFQKTAVRKLGLEKRVTPVMGTAGEEVLGGTKFDTVVLRAVGSMKLSLELARPYLKPEGVIILPRGEKDLAQAQQMGLITRIYYTNPEAAPRLAVLAPCFT